MQGVIDSHRWDPGHVLLSAAQASILQRPIFGSPFLTYHLCFGWEGGFCSVCVKRRTIASPCCCAQARIAGQAGFTGVVSWVVQENLFSLTATTSASSLVLSRLRHQYNAFIIVNKAFYSKFLQGCINGVLGAIALA